MFLTLITSLKTSVFNIFNILNILAWFFLTLHLPSYCNGRRSGWNLSTNKMIEERRWGVFNRFRNVRLFIHISSFTFAVFMARYDHLHVLVPHMEHCVFHLRLHYHVNNVFNVFNVFNTLKTSKVLRSPSLLTYHWYASFSLKRITNKKPFRKSHVSDVSKIRVSMRITYHAIPSLIICLKQRRMFFTFFKASSRKATSFVAKRCTFVSITLPFSDMLPDSLRVLLFFFPHPHCRVVQALGGWRCVSRTTVLTFHYFH